MSAPTTPCIACSKATDLGGNTVTHYGRLGDMCPDCSALYRTARESRE